MSLAKSGCARGTVHSIEMEQRSKDGRTDFTSVSEPACFVVVNQTLLKTQTEGKQRGSEGTIKERAREKSVNSFFNADFDCFVNAFVNKYK